MKQGNPKPLKNERPKVPEHGPGIWCVIPLLSKLPGSVQARIIKMAGQLMEKMNFFNIYRYVEEEDESDEDSDDEQDEEDSDEDDENENKRYLMAIFQLFSILFHICGETKVKHLFTVKQRTNSRVMIVKMNISILNHLNWLTENSSICFWLV